MLCRGLEYMVVQRSDLCGILRQWLRERVPQPTADLRGILRELVNLLRHYGKI